MKKFLVIVLSLIGLWWCSLASPQLDNAIVWMNEHGLTKFTNETEYMASKGLRRDEAAKFFVQYAKLLGKTTYIKTESQCAFLDIHDSWIDLKDIVRESCRLWLFQWSNEKFMPTQFLTNAQAITVLIRMIDWKKDESKGHFAQLYFEKAQELWIMEWLTLNSSANFDKLTIRGDVGVLIYNAFQRLNTEAKSVNQDTNMIVNNSSEKINGNWNSITDSIYLAAWLHKFRSVYNWESNFIVELIDGNWDYISLLANEIWSADSSIGIKIKKSWDYYFNIESEWPREITVDYETPRVVVLQSHISGQWTNIIWPFSLTAWLHKFKSIHNWESNFIVELIDSNWNYISLLANEIWSTDSSIGIKIEKTWDYYFNIDADWSWTIEEFR